MQSPFWCATEQPLALAQAAKLPLLRDATALIILEPHHG